MSQRRDIGIKEVYSRYQQMPSFGSPSWDQIRDRRSTIGGLTLLVPPTLLIWRVC